MEVFLQHASPFQPPDHVDKSLAYKLLEGLVQTDRWVDIDLVFDHALASNISHYREIEGIRRIEIMNLKRKGEYEKACKLIEVYYVVVQNKCVLH